MTIKSKYTIGKQLRPHFIPNKNFTDRELPKEAFSRQIETILKERETHEKNYHVLMYYGIGGVGKSTLIKELKRILTSCYENVVYTSADLANIPNQSIGRMLLELSRSFSDKDIQMAHFSVAYAIYFQKCNKDILYNQNKKLVFDENLGLVAEILGVIEGLGILGVIPNIVNKLYDTANRKWSLDKHLKEDLKKLEFMDVAEIENLLPEFWAYDLKKFTGYNEDKTVVIFLDTYEALWHKGKNEINKFSRDQSIRNMVAELPNILFVFSGREYLEWASLDSAWESVLEQHELERLDKDNADKFLLGCNVEEPDVREQMIKVSLGHPYYLDLLVDTYAEMRNTEIEPKKELIATNSRDILECFFKYLQPVEIEVIKVISVTRYYNFPLFCHLLSKLPLGYPVTKFEEFNKFSFVNKLTDENYHIHELMRKEVLEFIPKQLFYNININLIDYYNEKIDETIQYENLKLYIKECVYHYGNILQGQEYQDKITSLYLGYLKIFQHKGESQFLYEMLNNIFSVIGYTMNSELFGIYSDMVMLIGNFREAVYILDKYLESYHISDIANSISLLHLYVKKIKHQMTYEATSNTLILIEGVEGFIEEKNNTYSYYELLYTKANMLLIQGKYEQAELLLNQVIESSINAELFDLQCRALRKLADYYLYINKVREADEAAKEGLNLAREYGFDRYVNYLECTQAEIYRKLKLFEQTNKLYERLENNFQSLGIAPWVAHTNLGKAMVELEKGNHSQTMELLERAENIYKDTHHTWGKLHTQLLRLQCIYMRDDSVSLEEIKALKRLCKNMNYNEVLMKIEALENDNIIITNLLYL